MDEPSPRYDFAFPFIAWTFRILFIVAFTIGPPIEGWRGFALVVALFVGLEGVMERTRAFGWRQLPPPVEPSGPSGPEGMSATIWRRFKSAAIFAIGMAAATYVVDATLGVPMTPAAKYCGVVGAVATEAIRPWLIRLARYGYS